MAPTDCLDSASPEPPAHRGVWPPGLEPERADLHVHNELVINASPQAIWRWLSDAESWPQWYSHTTRVRHVTAPGEPLRAGSHFEWVSFHLPVSSDVTVHEVNKSLGWTARLPIGRAFHLWRIEDLGDGRTRVQSVETQKGFWVRLARPLIERFLRPGHQRWLEQLAAMATTRS